MLNESVRVIREWSPISDEPIYVADIAEKTRDLEQMKARSMMMAYFASIPLENNFNILNIMNLIDKFYSSDLVISTSAEERTMLTFYLAKTMVNLSAKDLSAQYHTFGINQFRIIGYLEEFYIRRFLKEKDKIEKVKFKFMDDESFFNPMYPTRFIEMFDLITSISIGTVLFPDWLDIERKKWDDPSVKQKFLDLFSPLSVVSAWFRELFNSDLFIEWDETGQKNVDDFIYFVNKKTEGHERKWNWLLWQRKLKLLH